MSNIPQEVYDEIGKRIRERAEPSIHYVMAIIEEWGGNAFDFATDRYHVSVVPKDMQPRSQNGQTLGQAKYK